MANILMIAAEDSILQEVVDCISKKTTNVVSQIRQKIGQGYIRNVVGSGYKFEA